jgi:hypothetical protein
MGYKLWLWLWLWLALKFLGSMEEKRERGRKAGRRALNKASESGNPLAVTSQPCSVRKSVYWWLLASSESS